MLKISSTNRCKLFESISEEIWNKVIYNHSTGINVSEIGITNDIIATIRYHHKKIPNFGVWSNPGYKEIDNGSDIDIFVETSSGNFIWYALQAKVLKLNKKYLGTADIKKNEYQWNKLQRLEVQAGCIGKYLFYNGIIDYSYFGSDSCNRKFKESQFGCSLVDPEDVEKIAIKRNPTFYDFHPHYSIPWREIVCCKHDLSRYTLFNVTQIKRAVDYYQIAFDDTNILDEEDMIERSNDLSLNAIRQLSEINNRTADFKIVVRRTDSL
ncbi:hypothetical protein SAMN04488034_103312 [Salinimicrobium catena]|uniref:Uncharacterized protein n=1 Tax=Salinimicrobium catena TaxID=390640 RepID=A0A1H5N5N5_9FLAO|nr:hypothetical protein [Salinimicrobium catena]SDL36081.1 hypothetical protein SAMN04488140_103312 [Salinimicrobium catena]SEE96201.1 hypothetical protein SAMN04488034_103312 [Salinimicrobium catena]